VLCKNFNLGALTTVIPISCLQYPNLCTPIVILFQWKLTRLDKRKQTLNDCGKNPLLSRSPFFIGAMNLENKDKKLIKKCYQKAYK
jgi:hypothetical protein